MSDSFPVGASGSQPVSRDPMVGAGQLLVNGSSRADAVGFIQQQGLANAELVVGWMSMAVDVKRAAFENERAFARRVAVFEILLGLVAIVAALVLMGSGFSGESPNPRRSPIVVLAMGAGAIVIGMRTLKKSAESFESHMQPFLLALRRLQD